MPSHREVRGAGLACVAYRLWANYWLRDKGRSRVPPLCHLTDTHDGAALIAAPMTPREVKAFVNAVSDNCEVRVILVGALDAPRWLGHWALFTIRDLPLPGDPFQFR